MKTYHVIIERGVEGKYSAYITNKNCEFGCIGEGNTIDETKADFYQAVDDMKMVYAKEGIVFPEVEFEFSYDIASFLNYFAYTFTLAGLAQITGIKQSELGHFITGQRKPTKSTIEKIEKSLHALAHEIRQVRFTK